MLDDAHKQPTSSKATEITTSYDMGEGDEVFILRKIASNDCAPKKIVC